MKAAFKKDKHFDEQGGTKRGGGFGQQLRPFP
jgi:hypothetical protein